MIRYLPQWYKNWLPKQAWYQKKSISDKHLYNQVAKQELNGLSDKDYKKLCEQKVTFQKRTTKQQKRYDLHLRQKLYKLSNGHKYNINHQKISEYTLPHNSHSPLGLCSMTYNNRKQLIINQIVKPGGHICTLISHNDPHCPCHHNGANGKFYKAPSNLSKGSQKELCPSKNIKKDASYGERVTQKYLKKHHIPYLYGYKLGHPHNYKKRLHLDFFIPKNFVGAKQNIGIEVDGIQHDAVVKLNNGIPDIQAKINYDMQQMRDAKKDTYCHEHNIKLIRIHEINPVRHGFGSESKMAHKAIAYDLDKQLLPLLHQTHTLNENISKKSQYKAKDIYKISKSQLLQQSIQPKTANKAPLIKPNPTPRQQKVAFKYNYEYYRKNYKLQIYLQKYEYIKATQSKSNIDEFKNKRHQKYLVLQEEAKAIHNYHIIKHSHSYKEVMKAKHNNQKLPTNIINKAKKDIHNFKHVRYPIFNAHKDILHENHHITREWTKDLHHINTYTTNKNIKPIQLKSTYKSKSHKINRRKQQNFNHLNR